MHSNHAIIESVRGGMLEPNDLVKLTIDSYMPNWRDEFGETPPTIEDLRQHIEDLRGPGGELPKDFEFIDWNICGDCNQFTVYDEVAETYRHLVAAPECFLFAHEHDGTTIPA